MVTRQFESNQTARLPPRGEAAVVCQGPPRWKIRRGEATAARGCGRGREAFRSCSPDGEPCAMLTGW